MAFQRATRRRLLPLTVTLVIVVLAGVMADCCRVLRSAVFATETAPETAPETATATAPETTVETTTEAAGEEPPISASDRSHWSFRPLMRPRVPILRSDEQSTLSGWCQNDVDHFILGRLRNAALWPTVEADRVTLIRRLSFDLTGLPPTIEEVDKFLHDPSPDALERLVDRLLNSPSYGERQAQHWLDLARFAETDGYEHDVVRQNAWQYRDWVIQSFNNDLPFDEFLTQQLAGDEAGPEFRVATGFLTCGPDMPDINLQDERRHSFLNEVTASVGTVFLGLQVGCAQCHDHKYDPISQLDFYRLRAFFDGSLQFQSNKQLELPRGNSKSVVSRLMVRGDFRRPGSVVAPRFLRVVANESDEPSVAADRHNLRLELARWLTREDHPLVLRTLANRLWQQHFGQGLSGTPGDLGVTGDSPLHSELLDWLATEVPRQGWRLKQVHRLIVTSATYRQASMSAVDDTREQQQLWQQSLSRDSMNRLYSRGVRRRLEGEAIRDAMLSVSGLLNRRAGGPGVRPPLPNELVQTLLKNQWPVSSDPAEYSRRSIYLFVRRNLKYPLFDVFDKPDTNFSCPQRGMSTTAPQALMLLNSEDSQSAARALAERVATMAGPATGDRVELLFRLTLSRRPTVSDRRMASEFLEPFADSASKPGQSTVVDGEDRPDAERRALSQQRLVDLCLAIMNSNEFIYID